MKRRLESLASTGPFLLVCGLLPLAAAAPAPGQPQPQSQSQSQPQPQPQPQPQSQSGNDRTTTGQPSEPAASYPSPWDAFDAGDYAQALDGFTARQNERPDDPESNLHVGAAHYKLSDFEAADAEFYQAAATGDDAVRAEALYNLGNSAYRQGKLPEAIDLYRASLEANPDDLDTKFNLEFVHRELQQRQRNQSQEPDGQEQDQEDQESAGQQPEDQDQGGQEQPQNDQQGERQDQDQENAGEDSQDSRDTDGDGLSDDLERGAENPTDPQSPDSDADGLPDGEEDRNRNGRVDPGETDPNNQDSDGDSIPDAADSPPAPLDGDGAMSPETMTPEEAARALQALEEGRLDPQRSARRGRRSRQAKDW